MSRYFTAEADLNVPSFSERQLALAVKAAYDGSTPVSARLIATFFHLNEAPVVAALERAERAGLVRSVQGRGWVPIRA